MSGCGQELCPNWAGDGGCPRRTLDIEPDLAYDLGSFKASDDYPGDVEDRAEQWAGEQ